MTASLISTGTLAQLRRVSESLLPDTAQILRTPMMDDGRGGQTPSGPPFVVTTVACRLQPEKGGNERMAADLFITAGYWRIGLPVGTDVTTKDRITVTTQSNRTFEVKAVDGPKSYGAVLRAYCTEML